MIKDKKFCFTTKLGMTQLFSDGKLITVTLLGYGFNRIPKKEPSDYSNTRLVEYLPSFLPKSKEFRTPKSSKSKKENLTLQQRNKLALDKVLSKFDRFDYNCLLQNNDNVKATRKMHISDLQ